MHLIWNYLVIIEFNYEYITLCKSDQVITNYSEAGILINQLNPSRDRYQLD